MQGRTAGGKGDRSKNRMHAVPSLSSTLSIGKPDPSWMLPEGPFRARLISLGVLSPSELFPACLAKDNWPSTEQVWELS